MLRRIHRKLGIWHREAWILYVLVALQVIGYIIHDWRF